MEILSNFSDSLKELITLHNLTEKSLAEKADIPVSSVSVYINGKQAPYLETLIKLADFFGCSVDFLLNRTVDKGEKQYKPCPPFSQRLNELLKESKLTFQDFQLKGISKSSFYVWKRGESVPTVDNLVKLAEVFECSVDFVLGRET